MPAQDLASRQSILADQFFYFFLRLRKSRIRAVVAAVNASYPEETAEQKARRLIAAQTPLSFLGGALVHLPMLIPGLGLTFEFLGFVGGTSAIIRMHLYLILEIALLYGKDIDDEARVPRCSRWLPPQVSQQTPRCSPMSSASTRYFPCLQGE